MKNCYTGMYLKKKEKKISPISSNRAVSAIKDKSTGT